MKKSIIVNNTVLSSFASVSRLDLLEKIFDDIYISPEVYDEIENGIKKGYLFQKDTKKIIDSKKWIHITNIEKKEISLYKELDKIVDYGEASCLAIAQMRGWIFLSDDDKARTYANENGMRYQAPLEYFVQLLW